MNRRLESDVKSQIVLPGLLPEHFSNMIESSFLDEILDMQEGAVYDPSLPLTVESLTFQYRAQAEKAVQEQGRSQSLWRFLAELWAIIDLEFITELARFSGQSVKAVAFLLAGKKRPPEPR